MSIHPAIAAGVAATGEHMHEQRPVPKVPALPPPDGTPSGGYYDPRVFDKRLRALLVDARILPKSRESSLVVTKLEEALLWIGEVRCSSVDGPMVGTLTRADE